MRKDKLYTVTQLNQPMFNRAMDIPQLTKPNLFAIGGEINNLLDRWASNAYGSKYGEEGFTLGDYKNSLWNKASGVTTALSPAITGFIGGGYSTGGVGQGISAVGNAVGEFIPGPVGTAVKLGSAVVGGAVDRTFGIKKNDKNIGAIQENTFAARNAGNALASSATSNDFFNAAGTMATGLGFGTKDLVKGGIFAKGKARRKGQKYLDKENNALAFQTQGMMLGANQVDSNQDDAVMSGFYAFGGPLGFISAPSAFVPQASSGGTGALEYGLMKDWLDTKKIQAQKSSIGNSMGLMNTVNSLSNRFDAGGSFFEDFSSDPIGAAVRYNQQLEAIDQQNEQAALEAQREADYANMQNQIAALETRNQGLQSLLNNQGISIKALQDAQLQALSQATPTSASAVVKAEAEAPDLSAVAADDANYTNLRKFIKAHEGYMSKAYWLPGEDAPSIGYGFYGVYPGSGKKIKMGDTITREEAEKGLTTVLRGIDNSLSKKVPNWNKLNGYQKDALRDLAYGTGVNGKHFQKNSRLFKALANEDWDAAANELISKSASLAKYNKNLLRISKLRQNMFRNGDYSVKAFGGELGTNGTDFSNGLLYVDEGGSHESNPFDGVPMGVDAQGVPNLVEEGETVYNDYVFSDRMKVPTEMYHELGLGGVSKKGSKNKGITFAAASKKLAKESEQRPNDPLSQDGLKASLSRLAEVQEAERMRNQLKDYVGLQELACGGKLNKYACGGSKGRKYAGEGNYPNLLKKWNIGNYEWLNGNFTPSNDTAAYIPYSRDKKWNLDAVKAEESSENFKNWTNFVDTNWDKPEVQAYLKQLDKVAGGNHLFDANGNPVAGAKDYFLRQRGLGDNGNHMWGYYHLTPTLLTASTATSATPSAAVATPVQFNYGKVGYDPNGAFPWTVTDEQVAAAKQAEADRQAAMMLDPMTRIAMDKSTPERTVSVTDNGTNFGVTHNGGIETIGYDGDEEISDYSEPEDFNPHTYPTWMRYAPVLGAGIMSLTDMLGLTNKPDYTYANKVEAAAERAGYAPQVGYKPIGNYLRYQPMDIWAEQNRLNANARGAERAILNSGINQGAKNAGILASNYNNTLGSGELYRKALEYNDAKRAQVADFNRKTDMFNSQMDLEAAVANARYTQLARQYGLSGLAQAAALRDAIDQRTGAAKSANLTNFLQSLGNIGRENFAMNQINWDRSRRHAGKLNGTSYDKIAEANKRGSKNKNKNKKKNGE